MTQYDSLEVGRRSKGGLAGDLPEDVACLASAAQGDNGTVAHVEVLRYLEDEDGVRVVLAVESDAGVYRKPGPPLVEAGSESHPADVSGAQSGSRRIGASRGVGVSGLHVTHGGGQRSWSGSRIVGRVHFPGH